MNNEWTKKVTFKIKENCWLISEHHSSDNGVPFSVYHNLHLRFNLPNSFDIDDDELIKHLEEDDDVKALTSTIQDGFDEHHDGSNFVGYWETEEQRENANDAEEELDRYFENTDNYPHGKEIWDAFEWYVNASDASDLGITAKTTDEELAEIIKKYEDGDNDVAFEYGSFDAWAELAREEAIEEAEEEIGAIDDETESLFRTIELLPRFECNICGQDHDSSIGIVVERCNVPVLSCINCGENYQQIFNDQ